MSNWQELKKQYNIDEAKFWRVMGQIHSICNNINQPKLIRQTNNREMNDNIVYELAKVCYGIKYMSDQEIANLINSYNLIE